jgi:hypothetical protein
MKLFLLTTAIFGIVLLGMSVGVIFGRSRIRGSCGGIAQQGDKQDGIRCDVCSSSGGKCQSPEGGQVTTNF